MVTIRGRMGRFLMQRSPAKEEEDKAEFEPIARTAHYPCHEDFDNNADWPRKD
jgi:hypothetical protein